MNDFMRYLESSRVFFVWIYCSCFHSVLPCDHSWRRTPPRSHLRFRGWGTHGKHSDLKKRVRFTAATFKSTPASATWSLREKPRSLAETRKFKRHWFLFHPKLVLETSSLRKICLGQRVLAAAEWSKAASFLQETVETHCHSQQHLFDLTANCAGLASPWPFRPARFFALGP